MRPLKSIRCSICRCPLGYIEGKQWKLENNKVYCIAHATWTCILYDAHGSLEEIKYIKNTNPLLKSPL